MRLTEQDAVFDTLDGVMREQLQDTDVLTGAGAWSEASFQVVAEVSEHRRQLPVAVDGSQIERGRFAFQNHQEMERIEDFFAAAVTPQVCGNDLAVRDDLDAIHVSLHRHGAKGPAAWDTVTIAVEGSRLILVHLAWLEHTGVEGTLGNRESRGLVLLETNID
jgi:hypothetical protein